MVVVVYGVAAPLGGAARDLLVRRPFWELLLLEPPAHAWDNIARGGTSDEWPEKQLLLAERIFNTLASWGCEYEGSRQESVHQCTSGSHVVGRRGR